MQDQEPDRDPDPSVRGTDPYQNVKDPHTEIYHAQYFLCTGDPHYVPYTLLLIS
jgi:hypothetical protein